MVLASLASAAGADPLTMLPIILLIRQLSHYIYFSHDDDGNVKLMEKSEAELIKDEIAVLIEKAKKNYDVEISKKIKKLKRKLRRLESN